MPILVVGWLAQPALAQADPPGRVARINHAQGPVVFSPAGDNEWIDAAANRPLTRGDRVWTDRGSRAELQAGSSAVRLDGQTHLEILALDDQSAQLSVTQGTVYVRVRSLPEGENFEIDTPNLAYRAAYPGDYRIDVDAAHGTTRVTIHSGTGAVYGENGQALPLGGGQQITFKGRSLAQLNAQEAPPQDAFDRWAAERNRLEDQSISARFVPREVVGYQHLDAHGKWAHDVTHGIVWIPHSTPPDWAPYRHGHWEWIAPWGWTWIDAAPWGFAPFHYGRWAQIESRWAWVPGRLGLRPVYAPALVAFVGGVNWSFSLAGSRPGVAWFPLAPGEAFQPGYRASPVYISNVNRNIAVQPDAGYAYQRSTDALTAISAEDFHRGKPMRAGWLRVAATVLTKAQIVPPPPMPDAGAVLAQHRPAPARVAPPPAAEIRQVVAQAAAPASAPLPALRSERDREREMAQREAAKRADKAQARAAQALAQQQADAERLRLAAEQQRAQQEKAQAARQLAREEAARKVQQARAQTAPAAATAKAAAPPTVATASPAVAAPARAEPAEAKVKREASLRAEQAEREQQARAASRAEQARREQAASRAEQARREQAALRAEQTRREQAAQRAEQTRREQAAQRAEQAKREQMAQRAKQAKREQMAQRAAQAKREQAALRAEQARRAEAAQRAEQAKQLQARREVAKREQLAARHADQARREAQAKREEQQRREAHAQRVEQARRAADREAEALRTQREEQARVAAEREAQALREQRAEREAQAREQRARREAEERQQAQREAWQRQQQALAEQWRREHQQWEQQQQRERIRPRPDLRDDRRTPAPAPEVWQRGIPILNPGRTS